MGAHREENNSDYNKERGYLQRVRAQCTGGGGQTVMLIHIRCNADPDPKSATASIRIRIEEKKNQPQRKINIQKSLNGYRYMQYTCTQ